MSDLDVEASKDFCDSLGESFGVGQNNHAALVPANFIYNGRQLNRQQEVNDTDQRGMVILLYAKGFS